MSSTPTRDVPHAGRSRLDSAIDSLLAGRDRPEFDQARWRNEFADVAPEAESWLNDLAAIGALWRDERPPPPDLLPLPYTLDDYVLEELLGWGGMGAVYRARQRTPNRVVAIKVIRGDRLEALTPAKREVWRRRFQHEIDTTATIDHYDNIVKIHGASTDGELAYYVMQHVDGPNLAERVRQRSMAPREAAECIEQVARAVFHVHQHGILHCDIKPSNILFGGSPPRPLITDFGLALSERLDLDEARHAMGTRAYMAPEQFASETVATAPESTAPKATAAEPGFAESKITESKIAQSSASSPRGRPTIATDIYALGATLIHLLVGGPPPGDASTATSAKQRWTDLRLPGIDADLMAICRKCLEPDPTRRYQTADRLASDLRDYLDGRPVSARRTSLPRHVYLWFRRHRALAGALTLLLVGASAFIAYRQSAESRIKREAIASAEHAARAERQQKQRLDHIDRVLAEVDGLPRTYLGVSRKNQLLAEIRRELDDWTAQDDATTEVAWRHMQIHLRLAQTYRRFGAVEGKGGAGAATQSFERASAICRRLESLEARRSDAREMRLRCERNLAELKLDEGRVSEAEKLALDGAQELRTLIADSRASFEVEALPSANPATRTSSERHDDTSRIYALTRDLAKFELLLANCADRRSSRASERKHLNEASRLYESLPFSFAARKEVIEDRAYCDWRSTENHKSAGAHREALEYARKCLERRNTIVTAQPTDEFARREQAVAQVLVADCLHVVGEDAEARRLLETASQTIRQLATTGTFTSEQLLDDGALRSRFAQLAMDLGQVSVAAHALAQAWSAYETVAKSDPHNRTAMRGLAAVLGKLAALSQIQGRKSEAESNALHALELRKKLSDGAPDDGEDLASLGLAQHRVAEIFHLHGETDDALVHALDARRTYERLSKDQRVDYQTQLDALSAESTLGDLLAESGKVDESEAVLANCLERLSNMIAQFPDQTRPKFLESGTAADLANLKLKRKEIPTAIEYADRAAAIADELVTIAPDNFRYQVQLISALLIASDAERAAGDLESAMARAARAVAISESAARIDAGHDELQRLLASAYLRLAKLLAKAGDRDGALRETRLSVTIRERRANASPSDWSRVRELRLGYHDLATNLASRKRHDEAREAWRRATETIDRMIAHRVATATDWSNLRADTTGLAIAAAEAGRTVEAVAARERLVEIAKYFVEQETTSASLVELRLAQLEAGRMLRDNGQPARAERFFIEALAVVGRLEALPGQEQASRIARVELLLELGRCDFGRYEIESARHWYEFARAELSTAAADQATRDRLTKTIARHLKDCDDVTQGLADPSVAEKVFKEARVSQDRSLAMLARVANAARRDDFASARATAERLAKLAEQDDSGLWLQAARAYALCVAARDAKRVEKAAVASIANANIETGTETGTETQAENVTKANSHAGADVDADADADAKRACELLVGARTASLFRNGVRYARLQSHEDLNSLRQRREFQQFLCETDPDFSPAPTSAPVSR